MVGGLWEGPLRTNAGPRAPPDRSHRGPRDPQFVADPEFLESEYREAQAEASRELQLVLDERVPLTRANLSRSWGRKSRTRWPCAPTSRCEGRGRTFRVRFLHEHPCRGM